MIGPDLYYVLRVCRLAIITFFLLGVIHLYQANYLQAGFALTASLGLVGIIMSPLGRRLQLIKIILLAMFLSFMGVVLVTGGTNGLGILWAFLFPLAAFFFVSRRAALCWLAALFALIALIAYLSVINVVATPYSIYAYGQLAAALAIVTVGVYAYQLSRERLASQALASRTELETEKLRADIIVRGLNEGVVTTDAEGVVTFMNDAAERLLGWQQKDLIGKMFTDHVAMVDDAGDPINLPSRLLPQTLHDSKEATVYAQYHRKDGKLLPIVATGTPLAVRRKTVGAIWAFRDMSDEQDMIRTKSEFVTLASHQLRTPIAAVSWLSELLLGGDAGKLNPEQRQHVEGIYHSNQRMAALVGEMLIVSSLDLRSLPVSPQKTDVAKLAADVVKEQSEQYKDRRQHIMEQYDHVPELMCDAGIMKLILRNLLSNAIKYTPQGGRIQLHIHADPHTQLQPGSAGSLVIAIADNGYGIPKSVGDKVFSKFFRGKNILQKDTDGTGLGLYMVQSLLQYIGGRITFISQENAGSTFTVVLPLEGMKKRQVRSGGWIQEALHGNMEAAHA